MVWQDIVFSCIVGSSAAGVIMLTREVQDLRRKHQTLAPRVYRTERMLGKHICGPNVTVITGDEPPMDSKPGELRWWNYVFGGGKKRAESGDEA